jgi:hypothetical protein
VTGARESPFHTALAGICTVSILALTGTGECNFTSRGTANEKLYNLELLTTFE